MISLQCTPAVPDHAAPFSFTQTVQLRDGDRQLGQAIWNATFPSEGVVQILELKIDPTLRRHGHGRRLLRGVIDQARAHQKLLNQPLRRLWIGVGHKTEIVGRAFLSNEGFHLISSTSGLLADQDLLIYVKSMD